MSRKIALKKLSSSDLTVFEYHLRKTSGTKQKCININADPFEKHFYPNIKEVAEENEWDHFLIELSIQGPGSSLQQDLSQKITKNGASKNWRLNGKYIPMPDGDERYKILAQHDYAILEFFGASWPHKVKMTLVAINEPEDTALHQIINQRFPKFSMRILEQDEIEDIYQEAHSVISPNHPFIDLLDLQYLEDAAQGGVESLVKLGAQRRGRGVSHEEFRKAKKAAEGVGRLGEELLDKYFTDHIGESIDNYHWIADENAVAPYDFEITIDGITHYVDAKSTAGPHTNPIHISLGELREMAWNQDKTQTYRLYRLFEVKEGYAKVKISAPMDTIAYSIIEAGDRPLRKLGTTIDSVSINPSAIDWEKEFEINFLNADETE